MYSYVQDLFGGVVYAGLDTDKYKYPIGELNFNILHKPQYVLNHTKQKMRFYLRFWARHLQQQQSIHEGALPVKI